MADVFKNEENLILVDREWLARLKEAAEQSPKRLSRLCMHRSTGDAVQEMLIAFCRDCPISPNSSPGRSESLTVIEGEMLLVVFDDNGRVTGRVRMGPPEKGGVFMYRLCSAGWHTMIPLSDHVIVHECIEGPFVQSNAPLPGWIPKEKADLAGFLNKLIQGKEQA